MRVRSGYTAWKVTGQGHQATTGGTLVGTGGVSVHVICKRLPTEEQIKKAVEETPCLWGNFATIESIEKVTIPTCIDLEPERKTFKLIEDAKKGETIFADNNGLAYVMQDDE